MNELALSPLVRIVPVIGDGMDPTLRPSDFALCRSVQDYQGEGIYLLSNTVGREEFFRVDRKLGSGGRLRLMRDNPHYSAGEIHPAEFAQRVLGMVLADIRTRVPVERWEQLR